MNQRTNLELRIAIHIMHFIFKDVAINETYSNRPSKNLQAEINICVKQLLKQFGDKEE